MTDSLSATSYPLAQSAVLASIALGVMLVPLNSTLIAIGLPDAIRVPRYLPRWFPASSE